MSKRAPLAILLVVVVALDQITKYLADTLITPGLPVRVLSFFHLVNVKNRGAAFGILESMGNWFFIPVSILAIALIVYLLMKNAEGPVGLTLIVAGAVGNLLDRVVYGHVRDFLDFSLGGYHWPAFNVADSALTVGLVFILTGAFLDRKRETPG